jgi:hypothetical protein
MKRSLLVVLASLVVLDCGLLAAGAAAKDGVQATLTSKLDLQASLGTTIPVRWTLADRDGHSFGAGGLFVRLLGREGGSTFAFARGEAGGFTADVAVPTDGIGGIRIGLRGRNDYGIADIYFPVINDPFRSPSGVRCDVAAVAQALRTFTAAFSRGDLRRLDALFARCNRFAWFSAGPPGARFSPDAGKRETLLRYFAAPHKRHDRIRLVSYRFNGYERLRVIGHFEFRAVRQADGYRSGETFELVGKGAIDCSQPPVRFMVMSIG